MTLHYPWAQRPELATVIAVSAGINWITLPLPFALNHVNLWLLDDGDNSLLIDTAVATQTCQEVLQTLLDDLQRPLQRLLVTHYHPDHIGLAGWLESRFGIEMLMTRIEWERAHGAINLSNAEFVKLQGEVYRGHGLDEERLASLTPHGNSYLPLVHALPSSYSGVCHGDTLSIGEHSWEVITVGGHSPDMICLYSAALNVLITADQILPSITPNISLSFYTSEEDPLGTFLGSFRKFAHLPDDVLVLPSHGLPYTGLKLRMQQLAEHHEMRLESLRQACQSPQTAASVLPQMFSRPLGSEQLMFAMGESIAHLRHLELSGEVVADTHQDVIYYSRS